MSTSRREGAQVAALWAVLVLVRWLAALRVTQPRIFRDELLHWQFAQSFVTHRPFVVSGEAVDYPAILYPAVLSFGLHTRDAHLAFHLAQGLNALMVSAVVFFAYALARELSDHRDALAVAALAGLAPGAGYSVFIMEESLYYPLFVASCWLCWRVLVSGRARDGAWCALVLGLTYLAKPLAVPLVAAFVAVVLLWAATELGATEREPRARFAALAMRLAPVVAFGVMLVVRHALTARGADETHSGVVLGRFYTDELEGAIVPPLGPMSRVMISLAVSLAVGVGFAPAVALLGGWRERSADRRRRWLAVLTIVVAAVYVLAAARHTMVINPIPKIHERYLFAVGPLLLALFVAARATPIGVVPIAVASAALALVVVTIPDTLLPGNTWVNAPSMTLAWLLYTKIPSRLALGMLAGVAAAAICWAARSREGLRGVARFATLAATLVVLNAAWYAFIYRMQRDLAWLERTMHQLETTIPADARITLVVPANAEPMSSLSYHGKFWLGDRLTVYWTGATKPAWYADASGNASDVVARTQAAYLVGLPGIEALCPSATPVPGATPEDGLAVHVLAVPTEGCEAPTR